MFIITIQLSQAQTQDEVIEIQGRFVCEPIKLTLPPPSSSSLPPANSPTVELIAILQFQIHVVLANKPGYATTLQKT